MSGQGGLVNDRREQNQNCFKVVETVVEIYVLDQSVRIKAFWQSSHSSQNTVLEEKNQNRNHPKKLTSSSGDHELLIQKIIAMHPTVVKIAQRGAEVIFRKPRSIRSPLA